MKGIVGASSWSLVALVLLVAAALGAAAAVALAPHPVPSALATAAPVKDVPVTTRSFDDQRTIELTLTTGGERQVTSPGTGVVTATACSPGGSLASGDRAASIDGQPVLGLATTEPLWRTLQADDDGDDVRSLQQELARLGFSVRADGIVGQQTLRAVDRFLGRTTPGVDVPVESFAWLPSATVTTPTCKAVVGGRIEVGEALATLPAELTGARVSSTPSRLTAGPRTATVSDTTVSVRDDGTIADPAALAALAGTSEYASAAASEDATTLTVDYALAEPLRTAVVPPGAVYDLHGAKGCVASAGRGVPVDIVGSELGETFVVPPEGQLLKRVQMDASSPSCR